MASYDYGRAASKSSSKDDDWHRAMLEKIQCRYDAENYIREVAQDEIEFARGDRQWPESVREMRENDATGTRPCLTINRLPAFIRQVTNELRQIKPDIQVRAIDSVGDPKATKIYAGMIKAIEADSNASQAYLYAASHMVKVGWGYWRIDTAWDGDGFDQKIEINRIQNQFSVLLGPHKKQDGSDAKWGVIFEQMSKDDFEEQFPGKATATMDQHGRDKIDPIWFGKDDITVAEVWELKDEFSHYAVLMPDGATIKLNQEAYEEADALGHLDGPEVRVREIYKPTLYQTIISGSEILEEAKRQPGEYIPIVPIRVEEDIIEHEIRYTGVVHDLQDPQRQYNYFRSASVEKVAMEPKAPFVGYAGQFQSPNWAEANVRNFPYLEVSTPSDWGSDNPLPLPQRMPGPQSSPGLTEQITLAAQEIKDVMGIQDPGLGAPSPDISGAAINARRSESDVGQYHFAEALGNALTYTGRILLKMIPEVYAGDRMIEIIDGAGKREQAVIGNVPQGGKAPVDLTLGRYDAMIDLGPSYATKRQESQAFMLELARHNPEFANLSADLMVKMADVMHADQLSERFKMLLPPEILAEENPEVAVALKQAQQQMQMMQQQNQMLQQQLQTLAMELQNKQGELAVKKEKVDADRGADLLKHTEQMTKLELDYSAEREREDVPGSAV